MGYQIKRIKDFDFALLRGPLVFLFAVISTWILHGCSDDDADLLYPNNGIDYSQSMPIEPSKVLPWQRLGSCDALKARVADVVTEQVMAQFSYSSNLRFNAEPLDLFSRSFLQKESRVMGALKHDDAKQISWTVPSPSRSGIGVDHHVQTLGTYTYGLGANALHVVKTWSAQEAAEVLKIDLGQFLTSEERKALLKTGKQGETELTRTQILQYMTPVSMSLHQSSKTLFVYVQINKKVSEVRYYPGWPPIPIIDRFTRVIAFDLTDPEHPQAKQVQDLGLQMGKARTNENATYLMGNVVLEGLAMRLSVPAGDKEQPGYLDKEELMRITAPLHSKAFGAILDNRQKVNEVYDKVRFHVRHHVGNVLDGLSIESFLPKRRVYDTEMMLQDTAPLFSCSDVLAQSYNRYAFLSVLTTLKPDKEPLSQAAFSSFDYLYVTPKGLLVTDTATEQELISSIHPANTWIHRFDFMSDTETPEYKSTRYLNGRIPQVTAMHQIDDVLWTVYLENRSFLVFDRSGPGEISASGSDVLSTYLAGFRVLDDVLEPLGEPQMIEKRRYDNLNNIRVDFKGHQGTILLGSDSKQFYLADVMDKDSLVIQSHGISGGRLRAIFRMDDTHFALISHKGAFSEDPKADNQGEIHLQVYKYTGNGETSVVRELTFEASKYWSEAWVFDQNIRLASYNAKHHLLVIPVEKFSSADNESGVRSLISSKLVLFSLGPDAPIKPLKTLDYFLLAESWCATTPSPKDCLESVASGPLYHLMVIEGSSEAHDLEHVQSYLYFMNPMLFGVLPLQGSWQPYGFVWQ